MREEGKRIGEGKLHKAGNENLCVVIIIIINLLTHVSLALLITTPAVVNVGAMVPDVPSSSSSLFMMISFSCHVISAIVTSSLIHYILFRTLSSFELYEMQ